MSTSSQNIWIGSDHGGFALKQSLMPWLQEQFGGNGNTVADVGADVLDLDDDYPPYAAAVARAVQDPVADRAELTRWGVLICRSGSGMAIAANRFTGVRAVVCRTIDDVTHAREHNNANIIVLEGDHIAVPEAQLLVQTFAQVPFGGERHTKRVVQLDRLTEFTEKMLANFNRV